MSEYATITKIIIKKLGPVTKIIAHSLGGIAAMAAATKNPIIEQMILISTPTSLLDVLDIWSSSVMKLGKRMRKLIVAQLLIDNGVPVSHWNIALHGKDWLVPVHVLHDKNDVVINVNHAKKISAALPKSNTWFTQGLGHTKILFSKNVHQQIAILFQQYKIIGSKTISDNHNNF